MTTIERSSSCTLDDALLITDHRMQLQNLNTFEVWCVYRLILDRLEMPDVRNEKLDYAHVIKLTKRVYTSFGLKNL